MNLSVSDFAWNDNQSNLYHSLNLIGVNQIEIILSKIKNWDELNYDSLTSHIDYLNKYKLSPKTMQSLFFGVNCKDISDVEIIKSHLLKLISFSKILSTDVMVFGSPSLRKKKGDWEKSLSEIFTFIDSYLSDDIQMSIEPNSKIYGGEFFFTLEEIINFIEQNNLKHVKTMIDTHNLIHENLNPITEFEKYFNYINHIHISETNLSIISDTEFHRDFSHKIKKLGYDRTITYEVKPNDNLINSIALFKGIYY